MCPPSFSAITWIFSEIAKYLRKNMMLNHVLKCKTTSVRTFLVLPAPSSRSVTEGLSHPIVGPQGGAWVCRWSGAGCSSLSIFLLLHARLPMDITDMDLSTLSRLCPAESDVSTITLCLEQDSSTFTPLADSLSLRYSRLQPSPTTTQLLLKSLWCPLLLTPLQLKATNPSVPVAVVKPWEIRIVSKHVSMPVHPLSYTETLPIVGCLYHVLSEHLALCSSHNSHHMASSCPEEERRLWSWLPSLPPWPPTQSSELRERDLLLVKLLLLRPPGNITLLFLC